ncbi:MAG: HlyD family secretion protein [Alphaproteobacteria bacterium]|nr:HlyD family secretion protein [Alphaproteobacteria bacterium]
MVVVLLITFFYGAFVWLIFFKLKLLKFNIVWGIVSFWVGFHLMLVIVIMLRFFQPYTIDAHIIRHTIQLVPRLPHPTTLEEVVVEANVPVEKGDPLFRFDRTLYEAQVLEAEAQLEAAKQNVLILEADVVEAEQGVVLAAANLAFAEAQQARFAKLARQGAARQEDLDRWNDELDSRQAQLKQAEANLVKTKVALDSEVDGVNTGVAQAEAQLAQAKYYLEQTTIYAPEDGFITNLQARPGLVVGILRVGAIASFVSHEAPYLLASFYQEHLKFVETGQPVEVALDIYPGVILDGVVDNVWWATGQGQYKPSGDIPMFLFPKPQGRFAVQIRIDNLHQVNLPAGAHGAAAIYTGKGTQTDPLRRIGIRLYTWANYLYPLDFI